MQSSEPNVEQIIRLNLTDRNAQSIRGAELGELLSFAGINYKANGANLTSFLKAHVPTLIEVGRAGQDKTFSFVSPAALETRTSASAASLWKEFASPNGSSTIVLDVVRRAVAVLAQGESAEAGLIPVNRVSSAELANIAKDYAASQAAGAFGSKDGEIRDAIANNDPNWYSLVRQSSRASIPIWNTYRISAIEQVFERRIQDALPETLESDDVSKIVESALSELRSSRAKTIRADSVGKMHVADATRRSMKEADKGGRNDQQSLMNMRELALAAVSQMSETDLSRVWVPLSSVLQVLRRAG